MVTGMIISEGLNDKNYHILLFKNNFIKIYKNNFIKIYNIFLK